jgi:DNA primase
MTRSPDFGRVRAQASFEQILQHYSMKIVGRGKQRIALCPFHAEQTPSCSIHLERKVFHCFGCAAKGSVLDFVAQIEKVSIHDAAARIEEICGLASDATPSQAPPVIAENRNLSDRPLRPLPFRLTLDPHPYLTARGISPEVAAAFGLGYCRHGTMKGRICIPIHDEWGALVAYAGRWASDAIPNGVPKYHFPRGFEKRRVLFGLHRVTSAEHLILVEGYWSVFHLHTLDLPAVALMGRTLSTEQETLLMKSGVRRLTLLLDGDGSGREATDELLPRLAAHFFVRAVRLPDDAEPDTVPEQFLIEVLCSNR